MPSSNRPLATAILAVYNGATTIEACLSSLVAQSTPIEIIVVDDGSSDNTVNLVTRFPKCKLMHQSHQGPALARNLGAKEATADILLFVDADMTFDPDYVHELIRPILAGEVIGTYTVEERVANWDNVWARCWNIQESWVPKKRFPANPPTYGTDFRAINRNDFNRVGGFDNIGYTDTWSLFNKLGVRPLSTHAICYHKNPDSLSAVFRQAKWSAKRPYKYGIIGIFYALLRSSLPISLVIAIIKSTSHNTPQFFVFKIVYDLGRSVGILEMLLTGKLIK